jgi:ornithine racemase
MYPRVEVSLSKLRHNTKIMSDLCTKSGIKIWGVTKVFCAIPEAANAIIEGGAYGLADSRVSNLIKLKDVPGKKVLLRIPMHTEVEDVVEYADYSLNSELSTLKLLGDAAVRRNKTHSVIIMLDLGDLREGVWPEKVDDFIKEAVLLDGIKVKGFGVNLTCYGGVIPDENNLGKLVEVSKAMEQKYGLELEVISGGNSSSVYLLKEERLPEGINNLRLGEILVLGRETAFGNSVEGLHSDVFVLKGEIVELKEKPSFPIGNIGMDAFGNKPTYEDKGVMKRAIVAVGRQDIEPGLMRPSDEKIEIIGASSDHTIIDVTNSLREYKVGDIVEFHMDYGCLLKATTSPYVEKVAVE